MAQEIDINLNVNTEQADKSLGSLKSQLRQAQAEVGALADKFGATSKEAVEAAKRAADLKDRIGDAKSLTDAFNPDAKFKALSASLTGVAGGFSVVTGAMGAFGGQSKAVEETLLKVQSAMAMASGLQAVGESIDSFKQLGAVVKSFSIVQRISTIAQAVFNAVMAANPVGAIVVAVTALIAAGYALVKMFQASSDATKKSEEAHKSLTKELDSQVKNQKLATQEADLSRDAQLKMAKASGKSAAEIRKLSVELANQEVTQKMANAQTLRAIAIEAIRVAGLKDATDSQKELAKSALKEFNDANDALKTSVLNRRKLLIDNKVAETQEQTDATKKANDKEKEVSDKKHADLKERLKKEADDLVKFKEEIAKNARDKQREEAFKAQDDIDEATKANKDRLLTEEELAIQKENEAYKLKYDRAVKAGLDTEELDKQHKNNLNNINNEYFAKESDAAIVRAEEQKALNEQMLQVEQAYQDAKRNALDTGLNILQQFAGKNKSIALAILAIQKGLAIADVVVGSAKAIALAKFNLAQVPLILPPGVPNPAFKVQAAATVKGIATTKIGAKASIAAILASGIGQAAQMSEGGGGGGGDASGGGGGGASAAAPSFNVVGQSGTNQIAESIGARESQPMRAFVVGGDVTTQQGLNRGIVQNATLG